MLVQKSRIAFLGLFRQPRAFNVNGPPAIFGEHGKRFFRIAAAAWWNWIASLLCLANLYGALVSIDLQRVSLGALVVAAVPIRNHVRRFAVTAALVDTHLTSSLKVVPAFAFRAAAVRRCWPCSSE